MVEPRGAWVCKRVGHARSDSEPPTRWRPASAPHRLVVRPDGTLERHLGGGARQGVWRAEGGGLVVQESGFDPVHVALGDGVIWWREPDEEHGGSEVFEYAPEPAFSLADAEARLKKTRDPGKLIAREGWVQRALREGDAELLAVCLRNKGEVYPDTLRDLNACPAAAIPAIVAALMAETSPRLSLLSYLPGAAVGVLRAALVGPAIADAVALAMAKAPNGVAIEAFELACGAASTLDLRDTAGVPLLFHAVLQAPPAWVEVALHRADPTVTLEHPTRLFSAVTSVEAPAGTDAIAAAALCIEGVERSPSVEPWRLAAADAIRAKAAMVGARR